MNPITILLVFLAYTSLIFLISWLTGRKADNDTYFLGNRRSPWYVVAYGMIGSSLSGVTFMSVPGWVGSTGFSYLMIVFGYMLGYAVIAFVLLPLYYKLQLTSVYSYLGDRFGLNTMKAGSWFFILSRALGSSLRMFLVINVLQVFVFDSFGIPFALTAAVFIILILLYTYQGGVRTIVWTDTMQTTFMLLALVLTLVLIAAQMNISLPTLVEYVFQSDYSNVMIYDFAARNHWLKQLLSGAFITIAMTGLDQDMMQKNMSCKTLKDARKNIFAFSAILLIVNVLFLILGGALFIFADQFSIAIPKMSDDLFPTISFHHLPIVAGVIFLIGIISAAYSSADGTLTALTTTFSIDILGIRRRDWDENRRKRIRRRVHMAFAVVMWGLIIIFELVNDRSVIDKLFTIAGYTYGPLLGLYAFGMFTKWKIKDKWVLLPVLMAPVASYLLSLYSADLFWGYKMGFELLIVNGLLTFLGLVIIIKKR